MTSTHPAGVTLSDYLDHALPLAERAGMDDHLAACDECRALVASLRGVESAVASLTPLEPPGRAWDRIERAIRQEHVRRQTPRWLWLGAAAVLALATFTGLKIADAGRHPALSPAEAPAGAPAATAQSVEAELAQAERHYQNAIAGLEQIANSEKGTLDPQTAATLANGLAVVDQAISESRAALRTQPGSEPAQTSLIDSFKAKMALLQDTVALIGDIRNGHEAGAARIVSGLKQKGT